MKQLRFLHCILITLLGLILISCSSDSDNEEPPPQNMLPIANAGSDITVDELTVVTLSGSGTDSDGTIATYSWRQTSGESVTLNDSSIATPSFTANEVDEATTYVFELTVADNNGATATDSVQVTVLNVLPTNNAPLADAGEDQSVSSGSVVTLSGTASDTEGAVTVLWTQIQGESVQISDDTSLSPQFTAPDTNSDISLVFEIVATDSDGESASDEVTVNIRAVNQNVFVRQGNWRVVRQIADYDNNGVFEGVSTASYANNNAIGDLSYTYTDDGTEDHRRSVSIFGTERELPGTSTVEYDANFRVTKLEILQGDDIRIGFTYEYADAESFVLSRTTYTIENKSDPNSPYLWAFSPVYNGAYIQSYESDDDPNSPYKLHSTIQYDANNRVDSYTTALNGNYSLNWLADGKLDSWESVVDGQPVSDLNIVYEADLMKSTLLTFLPGVDEIRTTYIYNAEGLPVRKEIDFGDDGVVNMVVESEWEQAPCYITAIWAPEPRSDEFYKQDIPAGTGPGTGWYWSFDVCQ